MFLARIKDPVPEHARDLQLTLSALLPPVVGPGLTREQIVGTALAAAIASRNPVLREASEAAVVPEIGEAQAKAARAAAAIMGMNNVYYRFTHLVGNPEYAKMPARLRMNVIGNPGVDKIDFELYSLAVSAINGCGA